MNLIINSNEFDTFADKLLLQKETFKKQVDEALTKLVVGAQTALKLELAKPWNISVSADVKLPIGLPLVDQNSSFTELCAASSFSANHGSTVPISFSLEIPSLTPFVHTQDISATNRESEMIKFGELFEFSLPDFSANLNSEEFSQSLNNLIDTSHVRERVAAKVSSYIKEKIEHAVEARLQNLATTLSFDGSERVSPTCNGAAAREVGWVSNCRIGPFPGEWHCDVSMPDYGMYSQFKLNEEGVTKSQSGGGLWKRAGKSSYSFPLSRFKNHEFPVSNHLDLEAINTALKRIAAEQGVSSVNKIKDLSSACYVPSFLFNPQISVIRSSGSSILLELHCGYAGCSVPVLSSYCTNINALNNCLLEDKIKRIHEATFKSLGSSYDFCVLNHHEEKVFDATLGSWFDSGARAVHVGYRSKRTVLKHRYITKTTPSGAEVEDVPYETEVWEDPFSVAPYHYYDVTVPIEVTFNELDTQFVAGLEKEKAIRSFFSGISEQATFLANVTNLAELTNLMTQVNNYDELRLVGATEKSLLTPEMAACFTDLNITDGDGICAKLLKSLEQLSSQWKDIFDPSEPGSVGADSSQNVTLRQIISALNTALRNFSCKDQPVFFSASQVSKTTTVFDGGSINLLLV